jgi:hypothetical protein
MRVARMATVALLGWALILIAACAPPQWASPAGPRAFQMGYHEGCDAGYAVAGSPLYERIDTAEPPRADEPYLSGWEFGFFDCRSNYDRVQNTIHAFFGPP